MSPEAPLIDIVPPAVWLAGPHFVRAYTPAMRRWVCIVALLAGFSGQGYAWSARPRMPVAIERERGVTAALLDPEAGPFELAANGRRQGGAESRLGDAACESIGVMLVQQRDEHGPLRAIRLRHDQPDVDLDIASETDERRDRELGTAEKDDVQPDGALSDAWFSAIRASSSSLATCWPSSTNTSAIKPSVGERMMRR